jgi:hypothetical protein
MTAWLSWSLARADDMPRLSAGRRLLWVASDRKGQPLVRHGHFAELPSPVQVIDALKDYANGPGAGRAADEVRWQLWDDGRVTASG